MAAIQPFNEAMEGQRVLHARRLRLLLALLDEARAVLAFGKSAQSWLGHQAAYDLWRLDGKRAELGVQRVTDLDAAMA
ncbi:hypothetical protein [Sinimarinibacterium sp. NLF-5-8]|uniref:hypothetical protein n=1 Tax=Sinimarinibacterium sp. NLF-5-8 TaxID=2698684 RepID=UPI00137C3D05|nr:hypothetical protein [Sinimarinibacterium sp. NLF-5-8]QHS09345.1 hypothetical protein GT972_03690 [Sinimarinibacterium sp. NLF-5-8]